MAAFRSSTKVGERWSTAASKPNSSSSAAHFSGPPAIPTARAPFTLAIWPTAEPTGPVAAATATVSPGFGLPISSSPAYAVNPGIPSTPRAVDTGAADGSSRRTALAGTTEWVCHPENDSTIAPTGTSSDRDSTTSQTVPPSITSPISSGAA